MEFFVSEALTGVIPDNFQIRLLFQFDISFPGFLPKDVQTNVTKTITYTTTLPITRAKIKENEVTQSVFICLFLEHRKCSRFFCFDI